MVTRQPHHEHRYEEEDAENRTSPEGPCGDVAAYVLGVLDPAQHVIFSRHLAGCESCQGDAADFGMFTPVLRQSVGPPVATHHPWRVTRSILVVAAGVMVALAAVLSVVESMSPHVQDPVEAGFLTYAHPVHDGPFPLFQYGQTLV
ncbi:zf-HC2 domain-containing protein [Lentzea sp. NPDC051213]|uniref:zf-HC2 domain-containing protein n=1 Tax=Lentzea sp. NPDC051213 TaxID=3364126 RepID=UPI0037ACE35D